MLRQSNTSIPSKTLHGLVAYHISQHVNILLDQQDENDTDDGGNVVIGQQPKPSEVFLSFLYRYGSTLNSYSGELVNESARTDIKSAIAAVGSCSNEEEASSSLDHCTNLFHLCWETLLTRLRAPSDSSHETITTTATSSTNEGDAFNLSMAGNNNTNNSSFSTTGAVLFGAGVDYDTGNDNEANCNNCSSILSPLIDVPRLHSERYECLETANSLHESVV